MSFPFPQPELDEEAKAAIRVYNKAAHDLQIAERRQMLYWAPVFCSCPAWWKVPGQDPPQASCVVHGTVLLSPDGGWI